MRIVAKEPFNLYLDAQDLKRLSKIAEKNDTSASRIIRELVRKYIAKNQSRSKGRRKP